MTPRTVGTVLAAMLAVLAIGACGDDDAGDAQPTTTSAPVESTTAPEDGEDEVSADLGATLTALGLDTLDLDVVEEGGSHPTLSWQAVDGADAYWLAVHDGDGRPFWAWTGVATSVRLGGGDSSETNQTAALTGTVAWSVMALDADGRPIALSEEASLEP